MSLRCQAESCALANVSQVNVGCLNIWVDERRFFLDGFEQLLEILHEQSRSKHSESNIMVLVKFDEELLGRREFVSYQRKLVGVTSSERARVDDIAQTALGRSVDHFHRQLRAVVVAGLDDERRFGALKGSYKALGLASVHSDHELHGWKFVSQRLGFFFAPEHTSDVHVPGIASEKLFQTSAA